MILGKKRMIDTSDIFDASVSVDMSSDAPETVGDRIYAKPVDVMTGSDGKLIILCEFESDNRAPQTSAKGVSIGDHFRTRGKHPREYTVVDIHTTTNSIGEIVKTEFKAEREFMGQKISELVVAPTVLLNKIAR